MSCLVHGCASLDGGGVDYMRSCMWRLVRWVLKNWWFTFSLIHFGIKLSFYFGGESKDTGYSKRDYKNGPLMIIGYQDS